MASMDLRESLLATFPALLADNLQRRSRVVERLVRKQQDGTLGRSDAATAAIDAALDGDRDMGVNVGNTIHHHYASPSSTGQAAAALLPAAGSAAAASSTAARLSTAAKAAIVAASLLGTGGLGAGVASLLRPAPTPVLQPVAAATAPANPAVRYQFEVSDGPPGAKP